jgi:hypothetical protein
VKDRGFHCCSEDGGDLFFGQVTGPNLAYSGVLQEIINVPVNFLLISEVSIDSLIEVLLCRADIDVLTAREEKRAQSADPDCPRILQKYIQKVSVGHA